jgi:hypothetical protein
MIKRKKINIFCQVPKKSTQQRMSLPSAKKKALGKEKAGAGEILEPTHGRDRKNLLYLSHSHASSRPPRASLLSLSLSGRRRRRAPLAVRPSPGRGRRRRRAGLAARPSPGRGGGARPCLPWAWRRGPASPRHSGCGTARPPLGAASAALPWARRRRRGPAVTVHVFVN